MPDMHISVQNFGFEKAAKCYTAEGLYDYSARIHQFAEIQCVLEGELEIEVDGVTERLYAGDIAVIGPFRTHSVHSTKGVRTWLTIFSNGLIPEYVTKDKIFINRDRCVFHASEALFSYIKNNYIDLGERVISLDKAGDLLFRVKGLIYPVLSEYVREVPDSSPKKKNNAMASILLYINQHFQEPLTRESVGAALGYSPTYVSHVIELIPNMNFRRLVNSIRIEYAKDLIREREMSMVDIALECGFTGERTFYRAFSELTGMTPLRYGKQSRNAEGDG